MPAPWIEAYVQATRNVIPVQQAGERYSRVISRILEPAVRAGDKFEFVPLYSYIGKTELVVGPSDAFLLYDQFLGDCFAALNWALRSEAPAASMHGFVEFLVGQRATHARSARPKLRYFASLLLGRQDFPWHVVLSDPTSESDGVPVLEVQETFVICHEYAHYVLRSDTETRRVAIQIAERRLSDVAQSVEEFIGAVQEASNPHDRLAVALGVAPEALASGSIEQPYGKRVLALLDDCLPDDVGRTFPFIVEHARPEEEIAADHLGMFYTALVYFGDAPATSIQWTQFLLSILIAHEHLRTLEDVNSAAERLILAAWGANPPSPPGSFVMNLIRRSASLHTARDLTSLFGLRHGLDWPRIHSELRQGLQPYQRLISEPVAAYLTQEIDRMTTEIVAVGRAEGSA
jgi:hypothetical protein